MKTDEKIGVVGLFFLVLKFAGLIALLALPVYLIYSLFKWFDE